MAQAIAHRYVDLPGWMCMLQLKCLWIQPVPEQVQCAVFSVAADEHFGASGFHSRPALVERSKEPFFIRELETVGQNKPQPV